MSDAEAPAALEAVGIEAASERVAEHFTRAMRAATSPLGVLTDPPVVCAVVAVVVREPDAEVSTQEIETKCREDLANFKVPKQIEFVEELPRNTMAKVQKNVLREDYAEIFA